jgi:D-alanyl-lipoteichoic acid acyltransferase DltB (MBOAT superfamily)
VWHGVGLWVWRQYAERTHDWTAYLAERPRLQRLIRAGGVVATFHYVCIGWVFFALPAPDLIGKVLLGLIGRAA